MTYFLKIEVLLWTIEPEYYIQIQIDRQIDRHIQIERYMYIYIQIDRQTDIIYTYIRGAAANPSEKMYNIFSIIYRCSKAVCIKLYIFVFSVQFLLQNILEFPEGIQVIQQTIRTTVFYGTENMGYTKFERISCKLRFIIIVCMYVCMYVRMYDE